MCVGWERGLEGGGKRVEGSGWGLGVEGWDVKGM